MAGKVIYAKQNKTKQNDKHQVITPNIITL